MQRGFMHPPYDPRWSQKRGYDTHHCRSIVFLAFNQCFFGSMICRNAWPSLPQCIDACLTEKQWMSQAKANKCIFPLTRNTFSSRTTREEFTDHPRKFISQNLRCCSSVCGTLGIVFKDREASKSIKETNTFALMTLTCGVLMYTECSMFSRDIHPVSELQDTRPHLRIKELMHVFQERARLCESTSPDQYETWFTDNIRC